MATNNISTEQLKAATYGAATQCSEAFAQTIKAMFSQAIEIAETFEKQAREIYNSNISLSNKKEPEKSVEVEPRKYKT